MRPSMIINNGVKQIKDIGNGTNLHFHWGHLDLYVLFRDARYGFFVS